MVWPTDGTPHQCEAQTESFLEPHPDMHKELVEAEFVLAEEQSPVSDLSSLIQPQEAASIYKKERQGN